MRHTNMRVQRLLLDAKQAEFSTLLKSWGDCTAPQYDNVDSGGGDPFIRVPKELC
jgi:hypothetical protein